MKARYLLPCSCGREILVETSQAGQVVRCQCGAELEAPTLLHMTALKRAPEPEATTAPRASRWGLRQRLVLIGMAITVPSLLLVGLMWIGRPSQESILQYAPLESLSYAQTWRVWLDLQWGVEPRTSAMAEWYWDIIKVNNRWIGVFLTTGALGVLLMLGSLLVKSQSPRSAR